MSVPDSHAAKPRTFGDFLLSQPWDSAIQLTLDSNSYYCHNSNGKDEAKRGKGEVKEEEESDSCLARLRRAVRGYFLNSSKTRLAVHGFGAAYLLYVVLHSSRNVAVTVTYDADKFSKAAANAGNTKEGQRPCPVRALRRLLQPLFFPAKGRAAGQESPSQTSKVFVYQSREGMQLLVKEPMTTGATAAHTLMSCLLIPLSLLQLESVFYMSYTLARRRAQQAAPATQAEEKATSTKATDAAFDSVKDARTAHCTIGVASVALMLGMAGAGYALRGRSAFSGIPSGSPLRAVVTAFDRALFYFALPWGVFSVGLMASAKNKKAIPHAIVGTLVAKACLAVALGRSLTGALQRLLGVHVDLPADGAAAGVGAALCPFHPSKSKGSAATPPPPASSPAPADSAPQTPIAVVQSMPGELERVYYISIATAAVVVGAWAVLDIVALLRKARMQFEEQERKKRA